MSPLQERASLISNSYVGGSTFRLVGSFFGSIAVTVFATNHALVPAAGLTGILRMLGAPLQYWRSLKKAIFDAYRPELHYMRGPGPKWRQKHLGVSS